MYLDRSMHRGFTLIELLVVIAIIGVLASVVLASLNSARVKARDAHRASQLREFQTALELYYYDNDRYPSPAAAPYYLRNLNGMAPTYMNALPSDPSYAGTGRDYLYYTNNPSRGYLLLRQYEQETRWCYILVGDTTNIWSMHARCSDLF